MLSLKSNESFEVIVSDVRNESDLQQGQVNLMNLTYKGIMVNSDSNTSIVSLMLKEPLKQIVSC